MRYLIAIFCLVSFSANASFEQGYMSPQDIIKALSEKFGPSAIASSCTKVAPQDRSALGDTNPGSGEIPNTTPGASFLVWYDGCITQYLNNIHTKDSTYIPKLLGDKFHLVEDAMKKGPYELYTALYIVQFNSLSDADQNAIVKNAMLYLIGSDEEILAYGRIQNADTYRQDLIQYLKQSEDKSLYSAIKVLTQVLLKRDEFLMY